MLDVLQLVKDSFTQYTGRPHKLSQKNRVMLYIMWLRSYPSYHVLALIFNVSVSTVQAEINACMPIFQRALESFVQWPALNEWRGKRGIWPKLPAAVGAIDGTSVEIYRPQIEPQELYYSGHRHYNAIHTQVIVDNEGSICYVESGFLGHQNDAQQYRMMRQIEPMHR
ncbi:unnamed protein product [Mytilus edulis]|uniref:DDE Tnp4 domain-containing protein n=1 Tax=Mytilus edulis TaxID=6550 RepID=A0A8S3US68_MYTED|nr:unnamed protein product [Mytilus edulis]